MQGKETEASIVERLMKFRLFAGMSREETAEIVRRVGADARHFEKDDVVVYEGTKAKWVVPILNGRLTIFEPGANGRRHPVRIVEAGHVFGATMVTSNLEYYPGMAVANAPSEVVFISIPQLRKLWCNPRFAKFFENLYSIVSDDVLRCWRKMSILSCKKAEDRVMLYLRWRASEVGESDFEVPFANSEVCAHYLGITRTALSLAVKRLVERGEIIHPGHRRFVICGIIGRPPAEPSFC